MKKALSFLPSCFWHATKEVWPFLAIIAMLPLLFLASWGVAEAEKEFKKEYGYDLHDPYEGMYNSHFPNSVMQ